MDRDFVRFLTGDFLGMVGKNLELGMVSRMKEAVRIGEGDEAITFSGIGQT